MNRTALITGASSGIGESLAHIHAQRKGDLVVVARSGDKLRTLKTELESKHGISVYVIERDLTEATAPKDIYDELQREGIEVEFLFNNAGFGGVGRFDEQDIARNLSMIQLNVTALTEMTYHFVRDMVRHGRGRILNVSSTASLMPGPLQAVYFATKAYVTSFSNALAEELRETGVTVTNLMPGATETGFGSVSGMDKTEMFKVTASSETVAQAGYNAMMKGDLDVIAGLTAFQKVMISSAPLLPKKMLLRQVRQMQEIED